MGSIISNLISEESEQDKMNRMDSEERTRYWKCNKNRIESREYWKKNKDEWYLEYMF